MVKPSSSMLRARRVPKTSTSWPRRSSSRSLRLPPPCSRLRPCAASPLRRRTPRAELPISWGRRLALPRLLALFLSGLAVAPHPDLCAQQGSKPEPKRLAQGESESPPLATELKEEAARQYQAGKYHQAIEIVERALQIAKEPEAHELRLLLARARSAIGVELFNAG